MAHSSGGGSHGGGFHSSGSHSSSHSSGSGSYGQPISSRYYAGATRYVWYGNNGTCHSLYKQGKREKPRRGGLIFEIVIISLILLPIFAVLLLTGFFFPRPLNTADYDTNIVIEDEAGLLTDGSLTPALEAFREKTGVTPGVKTLMEGKWKAHFSDLETYALSEYMRLYDDEKHWLLVISRPTAASGSTFSDWAWEGMIGDDCGPAINTDSEDAFTKIIHKHLLRAAPDTVGKELAEAYAEFTATCMEPRFDPAVLITAAFIGLVYALLLVLFIQDYKKQQQLYEAVPVPKGAKEYNCEYCGTMYVGGTVSKCPSCGAPVPAHNEEEAAQ